LFQIDGNGTIIAIASLFVIEKRDAPPSFVHAAKTPKLAGSGDKATLIIPDAMGYALEARLSDISHRRP
jgi:hypothetical protein